MTTEPEKTWAILDIDQVQEKKDRGKKLSDAERRYLAAHLNGGFARGPRGTPPTPGNSRRAARVRARTARKLNR